MFQFHKGAIRTALSLESAFKQLTASFNSIKVRLEPITADTKRCTSRFQFHKGAIRTVVSSYRDDILKSFNSIKVRLEPASTIGGNPQLLRNFKGKFRKKISLYMSKVENVKNLGLRQLPLIITISICQRSIDLFQVCHCIHKRCIDNFSYRKLSVDDISLPRISLFML